MADVINRTTLEQRFSVNTPDFPTSDWIINPDLSGVSGVPQKYWKVVGDTVVEMDAAEKAVVDAALLPQAKEAKIAEIDTRTAELIDQGFEWPPASGIIHSFSLEAQANLLGLELARNDPALVYPVVWNSKDDGATTSLADATEVHGFYLTALATKRAHLDSGTLLKDQVRAALTIAEVDAVIDPR